MTPILNQHPATTCNLCQARIEDPQKTPIVGEPPAERVQRLAAEIVKHVATMHNHLLNEIGRAAQQYTTLLLFQQFTVIEPLLLADMELARKFATEQLNKGNYIHAYTIAEKARG